MARRYGAFPSELLKLSADEFQFNLLVLSKAMDEEARQINKQRSKRHGK